MDLTGKVEIVNVSDTGRKRPHNEDSSASDPALGLAIVADGMGGYKAGEIASAIAVTTIETKIRDNLGSLPSTHDYDGPGYSPESMLVKEAIMRANMYIFKAAQEEPQCQGMGTTVVVLLLYDNHLTAAHVGDSRIYRFKNDKLEQITSDHSLVQELIDRGFFTPEEAALNTPKNLVTRALGIDADVEVDIVEEEVEPGDMFLLCSDGLNDMIDDEVIRLTLDKYNSNLVRTANELIRLANENGGNDNISVILLRMQDSFPARMTWQSKLLRVFGLG